MKDQLHLAGYGGRIDSGKCPPAIMCIRELYGMGSKELAEIDEER